MRKKLIAPLLLLLYGAGVSAQEALPASNPFAAPSSLPYGAPPFDRIHNNDYAPALDAGLRERLADVERIANNPAPPTFENTIVALDKAGALLARVGVVFNAVASANTNDTLQRLQEEFAKKAAASRNALYLNAKLFAHVQSLYNRRQSLKLDAESLRLLELNYQRFVLSGAKLSEADKVRFAQMNEEEAGLSARFSSMLINGGKASALVLSSAEDLVGLSDAEKASYASAAKARGMEGKWVIGLKNTTQQPALASLQKRDIREALFEASWNRAERGDSNDTRAIILRLVALRAQKAAMLGFKSYAQWKLQDQMAQTPENVDAFFAKLTPLLRSKVREESADIQAQINRGGEAFKLQPWDWDRYSEQVRKAKYDLDESEVKPYFELNTVIEKGVFYAAGLLYGITFRERHDIPVWHPDMRVWEVFDQDGKPLALFYGDYYKRDNKNGGAWMNSLVPQSGMLGTRPVVTNNLNIPKPAPGEPTLLSFDEVRTLFHEFGHALHGMFSNQKYLTLSGTSNARDFVEFPSQFNEHWALDPAVLRNYAVHYQTKQTIPQALVEKIRRSATFNQGYELAEAVEGSLLDMSWHKLAPTAIPTNVDSFEAHALRSSGLYLPQVPPRYRSSYFLHIFSNGYSAGYYAYQWTKMLSEDAFAWFTQHGGLTRANGDRFRRMVLSRGSSMDYRTMYRAFRGKDPDIKPMQALLGGVSR